MGRNYLVMGPKTARDEFERFARDGGFSVTRMRLVTLSAEPTNAAECLRLVFSKEGAVIFVALAAVIRAYLTQKASRRIGITLFANGSIKTIDARGYTERELSKILPECREILVHENAHTKNLTHNAKRLRKGHK